MMFQNVWARAACSYSCSLSAGSPRYFSEILTVSYIFSKSNTIDQAKKDRLFEPGSPLKGLHGF